MHPANVACLSAAKIDCCLLANNHAADWGYVGLVESISTLKKAKIAVVGVGNNAEEAATPSIHLLNNGTRVLVFGFGSPTAGVSSHWAATGQRAGVNYLPDLGEKTAKKVIAG
jgi:poly-gamma-glutamate synthesis protein (capsule biosynthesis protein)